MEAERRRDHAHNRLAQVGRDHRWVGRDQDALGAESGIRDRGARTHHSGEVEDYDGDIHRDRREEDTREVEAGDDRSIHPQGMDDVQVAESGIGHSGRCGGPRPGAKTMVNEQLWYCEARDGTNISQAAYGGALEVVVVKFFDRRLEIAGSLELDKAVQSC